MSFVYASNSIELFPLILGTYDIRSRLGGSTVEIYWNARDGANQDSWISVEIHV